MRAPWLSGVLCADIRRVFGWPFLLSAALTFFAQTQCVADQLHLNTSVVVLYETSLVLDSSMQSLIYIIAGTAFSTSFIQDWNSRYIRQLLLRCGRNEYIVSKLIANAIATILAVWLGIMLFILYARTKCVLVRCQDISGEYGTSFSTCCSALVCQGQPFAFMALNALLRALAMVFWTTCAMAVSAFVANGFVALSSPWLLRYGVHLVESRVLRTPYGYRFLEITEGNAMYAEPCEAFLQMLIRFVPMTLIAAVIFWIAVKRRLRCV